MEEGWDAEAVVVVEIQEYAEDNQRNDDEALEQVADKDQPHRNADEQQPAYLYGCKFAIMPVHVIEHGCGALVVLVAGEYEARFFELVAVKGGAFFKL